jgi:hypothetical protein
MAWKNIEEEFVFCFELPDAASERRNKSLQTMDCVVGAVGIEPTTSPV